MHEPAQAVADATAAGQRGDWEAVVALLADLQPTEREQRVAVALLRAGAAVVARAPAVALDQLDALAGLAALSDELARAQVLRGRALLALGRVPDGLSALREAVALAPGAYRAQALLALADGCLRTGRLDEVGPVLDSLPTPDSHDAEAALIRARGLAAHGWLELLRTRRPIAARHFRDALDALRPAAWLDPDLHASLLEALLGIALDTLDPRLLKGVRADVEAFDWSPAALQPRARAVGAALVRADLLVGDLDAAWDRSFTMRQEASPGIERLRADLLAVEVARAAGERWTPDQIIDQVAAAAGVITWTHADARILLETACEVATRDPDAARALVSAYDWLPPADPAEPVRDLSDIPALELLARAALEGATDQGRRQLQTLRCSIARWRDVGHAYGELRAVLALARVEGNDVLLQRADDLSRLAPRSWLRREYETVRALVQTLQQLTLAERKVMLALMQGMSTAQIGHALQRSRNTIRNQTGRVFRKVGVRSRSALVVRCAELGLLAPRAPAPGSASHQHDTMAPPRIANDSPREASARRDRF